MPDVPPLVLAGHRGWLFDETMHRIDQMGLGDRIIWSEGTTQEELVALYNMALVLVMPSFYEGFGLPALEAMACGTVPIVSNRSSLPEVVGDVGLQIDPENVPGLAAALQQALTDTVWRKQMEAAGLARAATFTWENTAASVLSTYRAVW